MESIFEVVKIQQVIKEVPEELKVRILEGATACQIAHYFIGNDDREVFLVICLNANHNVIAVHRCHVGTLTSIAVSPREVFKASILNNASFIIVAHNHPSTNLQPSEDDFNLTEVLMKAGIILNIPVLDHIIINGKGEFFSFRNEGYIKNEKLIRQKKVSCNKKKHGGVISLSRKKNH